MLLKATPDTMFARHNLWSSKSNGCGAFWATLTGLTENATPCVAANNGGCTPAGAASGVCAAPGDVGTSNRYGLNRSVEVSEANTTRLLPAPSFRSTSIVFVVES